MPYEIQREDFRWMIVRENAEAFRDCPGYGGELMA